MILERLVVEIDAEIGRFTREFAAAEDQVESFGLGAAKIGTALTVGVTVPLTALGVAAVSNASKLDSLTRALEAVSDVPVGPQLERLRDIARLPGLSFEIGRAHV